jgi:hypothetical protein
VLKRIYYKEKGKLHYLTYIKDLHIEAASGIIRNKRVGQWVIAYINEDYSLWFCFHTNFVKAYLPPCKDIYSVGISPYYVECLAVVWMDQR